MRKSNYVCIKCDKNSTVVNTRNKVELETSIDIKMDFNKFCSPIQNCLITLLKSKMDSALTK